MKETKKSCVFVVANVKIIQLGTGWNISVKINNWDSSINNLIIFVIGFFVEKLETAGVISKKLSKRFIINQCLFFE